MIDNNLILIDAKDFEKKLQRKQLDESGVLLRLENTKDENQLFHDIICVL